MGLLVKIGSRFLRGRWGSILPALFKGIAEGKFGELPKRIYWFGAGHRTVTGAILLAAGAGLETIASAYPEWTWAAPAARYVYAAGAFLTTVGLVDGGVRSPWPAGTVIPPEDKQ